MKSSPIRPALAVLTAVTLALAGCNAGSRTGAAAATQVDCNFAKPAQAMTVNVLAYNSSAIDPFTNTMVKSCTREGVTVVHDPIDFAGQVTKTTATLAGETGTYDIVETYSYVIPQFGNEAKIDPLDSYYEKYKDQYKLGDLNETMRKGMSYDGKLYALPMQAQMFVMAYRKDVFDKYGLKAPTTFEEMKAAAKTIQDGGDMKYPIALPMLASSDVTTQFQAAMNSLGGDFVDESNKAQLNSDVSKQAMTEMMSLMPFMDPQVTTFDQPKVQQQMYNGTAAMSIMFSGRMNDLVQEKNSKNFDKIAFAAPPSVKAGGKYAYSRVSIDGWSIPKNTKADKDMLFQMMASSVSEDASKASVPAAYPARNGMVTGSNSPYGEAANTAIEKTAPPINKPYLPAVTTAIRPVLVQVLTGQKSVDAGAAEMQQLAEKAIAGA